MNLTFVNNLTIIVISPYASCLPDQLATSNQYHEQMFYDEENDDVWVCVEYKHLNLPTNQQPVSLFHCLSLLCRVLVPLRNHPVNEC